jgi:hypothetical protein
MLGPATATESWRHEKFPLFLEKAGLTKWESILFEFDAHCGSERS